MGIIKIIIRYIIILFQETLSKHIDIK